MYEGGRQEIAAFLPGVKDVEMMDMDEFLETLAQARYVQMLHRDLITAALSKLGQ